MDVNQNPYDLDDDLYEDEDTQKDKYLTFHIGTEDYGISIAYVTEIISGLNQGLTEVLIPAGQKTIGHVRTDIGKTEK